MVRRLGTRLLCGLIALPGMAAAQAEAPPPPAVSPAPVLIVPGTPEPARTPAVGPAGPPSYQAALPPETPEGQRAFDPAAPVTDFLGALERAYWTSPQLLAERAQVRSADFRVPGARGQYGPRLDYSISRGYQRDSFDLPLGAPIVQSGWSTTARAILTQPLFTFGRLRAGEDAAQAGVAFARATLRAAEQQALFFAINAYSAVLRDRTGVRIASENLTLLSQEDSDTRARLTARETTITDAQQVQTRLDLSRAQLLVAQAALGTSEALFLRYVGGPAGDLAQPNPLMMPAATLEEAYALADARNPVLAAAYARERVSRAEVSGAKAELLPRIDLTAQAATSPQLPYSDSPRQSELRAGVTLSGTIDSGTRRARIGELQAANDADWRLIDAALRENRAELAGAWNEWQAQSRAIVLLDSAAASAAQALAGALLQERAGLRTTLDVLDLARDLLLARSNLNSASAAAFVAQARVLAAMGMLDRAYLTPDAPRHDPSLHYAKVRGRADVPLLTPLVRALDSLTRSVPADRPIRDPAAPVAVGPATVAAEPLAAPGIPPTQSPPPGSEGTGIP